jgi:hypothetical protein
MQNRSPVRTVSNSSHHYSSDASSTTRPSIFFAAVLAEYIAIQRSDAQQNGVPLSPTGIAPHHASRFCGPQPLELSEKTESQPSGSSLPQV